MTEAEWEMFVAGLVYGAGPRRAREILETTPDLRAILERASAGLELERVPADVLAAARGAWAHRGCSPESCIVATFEAPALDRDGMTPAEHAERLERELEDRADELECRELELSPGELLAEHTGDEGWIA